MRHQHLLLPQHPPPLKLHLLLRLPMLPPLLPWLALLKPLPVLLLTRPPLALLMLPKPLSTQLLKPPKPLPSLRSNGCIRAWCPSVKKPPLGGFLVVCPQRVDSPAAPRIT